MITLYDTSIASKNVGDFIIMDAVKRHLYPLISDQIATLPTHDSIGRSGLSILKNSKYSVVGGSNLLSSHILNYNQWKFSFVDLLFLKNSVLMGVGWWQYQDKPDKYTEKVLKRILSDNYIHSVRDNHTLEQLKSIGFDNVLNTSCPTMWDLTKAHCGAIKSTKSDSVVFTLTDYNKDIERDGNLLKVLNKNYKEIYYWPQGYGDLSYLQELSSNKDYKFVILNPHLISLNAALEGEVDYIGTRLHAGIRALQLSCRTIIIGIDNRAEEKAKDFKLSVLPRNKILELETLINSDLPCEVIIPEENIEKWKSQFN
ncbi:polysaccharide pyruvyl transferase family protein [Vibrio breoganii]|uniref:polysaccharide pyruvyl transferase family protein n=1 Tax=Vibrio breoganii TaxID=553239 RepID=UPI000C827BFF|nr:polysaccharide pyruvyl transferase family protein [Vibrio breoganii]PML28568.1 hypothetical protein BCT82_06835 [Vibrio breoganii]